jgi:hypothetical protein
VRTRNLVVCGLDSGTVDNQITEATTGCDIWVSVVSESRLSTPRSRVVPGGNSCFQGQRSRWRDDRTHG